jgi:hypothetical protein
MEPLAKIGRDLAQAQRTHSGMDRASEEVVINAVVAMFSSLNTYGKKWSPVVAQGWLMALRVASDVTVEEMVQACGHWMANVPDFPAPVDVFAWIRAQREDRVKTEWLKSEAERFEREDRAEREARNIELFGHPNPTREDWLELLGQRFMENMLGIAPGSPVLAKPGFVEPTADDLALAEERRRALRLQAGAEEER